MISTNYDLTNVKSGEFATLDDSMIFVNGLYVYGHALVIDDFVKTLVFNGTKEEVYSHEKEIRRFIRKHVTGERIYACSHYGLYKTIQELVFEEVNKSNIKGLPKIIRTSFHKSDKYAKQQFIMHKKS